MLELDLQYPSDDEDMEGIRYPTPPPIEDGDPSLLESVSCILHTMIYLTFLAVLRHVSEREHSCLLQLLQACRLFRVPGQL